MNLSMRRRSCLTVLTVLLAVCCMLLTGRKVQAEEQNGYTYEVTDSKATITGYTGSATTITIPSTLGGYDVTAIGENAFSETDVVSVKVPDSVTSLGTGVFCDCDELTSISLSANLTTIPDSTFLGCTKLDNVTVPSGVKIIGPFAFNECSSLKNITLPVSLTHIYYDAFIDCTSLESITIPQNVSYISSNIFAGCTALKEIKLAASNTNYDVEDGVLFNVGKTILLHYPAGKLNTAYQVPSTVTQIASYAFSSTAVTQKVFIPDSVTTYSSDSFYNVGNQLRICASTGSYALTYAKNCGIPYTSSESYVAVTGLEYTGNSVAWVSIDQKTYQFNVSVLPSDASDQAITFTSSDTSVATISNTGLVTFKSAGFTLLTAKYGNYKKQLSLTIKASESGSSDTSASTATTAATATTQKPATTATTKATTATTAASKIDISAKTITVKLSVTSYAYTGGYKKPAVTVYNGKTKVASSNYTVTYANNKAIGTATVTIKGANQYTGSRKVTFKIVPPTVSKVKLTGKKKSVYATWGKVSSATGYQVYYSLKKNSGYKRAKTISSNKTVKYTISKLSAKKTYYVRIRAYKKVGKTVYYGAFSAAKAVKTKK